MAGSEAIGELCASLRSVIDQLDELAYDALREAVASGATGRPEIERRIVRARNAVERAISILERREAEWSVTTAERARQARRPTRGGEP